MNREKVKTSPLKNCFPDYRGDNSYENVCSYIADKFIAKNRRRRQLYVHQTCATDTGSVETVFNDIANILLQRQLEEVSLL
jgi:guanine nucleotide-binding protein G(i) subunit alpha